MDYKGIFDRKSYDFEKMKRFDYVCLGVCLYEMVTGEYANDKN